MLNSSLNTVTGRTQEEACRRTLGYGFFKTALQQVYAKKKKKSFSNISPITAEETPTPSPPSPQTHQTKTSDRVKAQHSTLLHTDSSRLGIYLR